MEVKEVNSSTIRMNSEKENLENPEHFIEKYDPNSLKIKISKTRPLENVSKWHKKMVRKYSSECQSRKTTSHSVFSLEKENTTSDKKRSLKVENGVERSRSKRIKISDQISSNNLKKSMIIPYSFDPNEELTSKVPSNRKIYNGKRPTLLVIPSLRQICCSILQRKLDSLKITRNRNFTILKPVLVKVTPKQLSNFEKNNPYVLPFTDVFWESHCKTFINENKDKKETWREMYVRCKKEREEKIRNIIEKNRKYNKGAYKGRLTKIIDTLPPKKRGERSVESTVHESSMKTSTPQEFQMFTKNVSHNSSSSITTSATPAITEKKKTFSSNNERDVSKFKKLSSKTLQNDTKTSAASATEKSVSKNLTKSKRKGCTSLMKKAHQIMKENFYR
ncbi:UNVERIFIED_CONTAM: hypothetical protein RMT77_002885 [Armadillidium vulgare]